MTSSRAPWRASSVAWAFSSAAMAIALSLSLIPASLTATSVLSSTASVLLRVACVSRSFASRCSHSVTTTALEASTASFAPWRAFSASSTPSLVASSSSCLARRSLTVSSVPASWTWSICWRTTKRALSMPRSSSFAAEALSMASVSAISAASADVIVPLSIPRAISALVVRSSKVCQAAAVALILAGSSALFVSSSVRARFAFLSFAAW